jgi:hypothetical protein
MPGFAASLSDKQVADIAAWLRQRYAPDEPVWQDPLVMLLLLAIDGLTPNNCGPPSLALWQA